MRHHQKTMFLNQKGYLHPLQQQLDLSNYGMCDQQMSVFFDMQRQWLAIRISTYLKSQRHGNFIKVLKLALVGRRQCCTTITALMCNCALEKSKLDITTHVRISFLMTCEFCYEQKLDFYLLGLPPIPDYHLDISTSRKQ